MILQSWLPALTSGTPDVVLPAAPPPPRGPARVVVRAVCGASQPAARAAPHGGRLRHAAAPRGRLPRDGARRRGREGRATPSPLEDSHRGAGALCYWTPLAGRVGFGFPNWGDPGKFLLKIHANGRTPMPKVPEGGGDTIPQPRVAGSPT